MERTVFFFPASLLQNGVHSPPVVPGGHCNLFYDVSTSASSAFQLAVILCSKRGRGQLFRAYCEKQMLLRYSLVGLGKHLMADTTLELHENLKIFFFTALYYMFL